MTFPLMDRTRRLTEEALGEAGSTGKSLDGVLLVGGSTRMPMVRSYVTEMAGKPPRTGVNVDEVVALGAAIQAAIEVGQPIGDALPRFTLATGAGAEARRPGGRARVTDVMSHSLGTVAVSPDGSSLRQRHPDPPQHADPGARTPRSYLHATHGGANTRLEVYLTQGESTSPLDCTILGKYVFTGIHATDAEVMVDVGMSYDANGVVQVQAVQRDTGHRLALTVEPVPDDLSWLGRPPEVAVVGRARADSRLPADRRLVEHGGQPLVEAQTAAARVPRPLRLHDHGGRPDLVLEPGRAPGRGDRQRPPAPGRDRPARGRGLDEPDRRARDGPRAARGQPTGPATS